ncbi:lasso peptide biosynthesis PqqD family chaperone [Amycolatopsis sp. NPDC005003]
MKLRTDVTLTAVEDGAVLLDERDGSYWQLNGTAATSLRLLLEGNSAEQVAELLSQRHPDAASRALGDVEALLAALHRNHLVVTA